MRAILERSWLPRALRVVAGVTTGALIAGVIALVPGVSASASSAVDRILFANDAGGDLEIFSVDPDGSDLRQLTSNSAWDTDPVWSPDGTRIAFSSNRDGDDDIWLMNADATGTPVNLTNSGAGRDVQPEWSRDGTKIAFVRDGYLHLVPATGGSIERRVRGAAPAWSPVQAKVAFARGGDIYVMDPDGTGVTALTSGEEADSPDWSPDGSQIAFESTATLDGESRIKKLVVATKAVTELPGQGEDFHPSWSPDGAKLVFANLTLQVGLVVADADGLQRHALAGYLDGYEVLPSWSGCVGAGCTSPTASPSESASPTESTSPTATPTTTPTTDPTSTPTEPAVKEPTRFSSLQAVKLRRIKVVGAVEPAHPGLRVRVILAKRKGGRWVKVARKTPLMNDDGVFVVRFRDPARARRCRVKAVFPGDADHLRSVRAVRFRC